MAKTRQQKTQTVEELAEKLGRTKGAAIVSVHGYTIADAMALRKKGKEKGVEFNITKKTLLHLAAQKAGIGGLDPKALDGSLLFAFGYEDEVSAAKLLSDLLKQRDQMRLLGGILERSFIDAESTKRLAKLPSKEELLGKLVGTLHAPVSGFVQVLAGNVRGLVQVLNAIKESKV